MRSWIRYIRSLTIWNMQTSILEWRISRRSLTLLQMCLYVFCFSVPETQNLVNPLLSLWQGDSGCAAVFIATLDKDSENSVCSGSSECGYICCCLTRCCLFLHRPETQNAVFVTVSLDRLENRKTYPLLSHHHRTLDIRPFHTVIPVNNCKITRITLLLHTQICCSHIWK